MSTIYRSTLPILLSTLFSFTAVWAIPIDDHLLISEAVLTPTSDEYLEIANPTASTVSLDNYYLSDDEDYALLPGQFGTGPAPSIASSDFIAQFPVGATIAPGAVLVIAFDGAGFLTTFGFAADYEIKGTDTTGTPDMVAPFSGSIGATAGLTNSGENAVLFYWDAASDLVMDVDMVNLGTPSATNDIADKTSVSVDGPDADTLASTYLPDAVTMPQQPSDPGFGFSTKRIALEGSNEVSGGGNGITGDDETTENILVTWDSLFTSPNPGVENFSPPSPPELMWYKFDEVGGSFTENFADSATAVNDSAEVLGALSMGGVGQTGAALIGSGGLSSSDYVNTNWATSLSGDWTISMWLNNLPAGTALNYLFGDPTAGTFRCFYSGAAGEFNLLFRGPLTEVLITDVGPGPSVVDIVYDSSVPEIRAYVDGIPNNTVAQAPLTISGTGPFKIGGYSTSAGMPGSALMDEFKLYTRQEVTPLPAVDMAVIDLLNFPGSALASSVVNFDVVVRNLGSDPVASATLDILLNGGLSSSLAVGSLNSLETDTISASVTASASGRDSMVAALQTVAGDANLDNDSLGAAYDVASPIATPYWQDFDGVDPTVPDALPAGWTNETGDDFDWDADNNGTPSGSTGPLTDHTTGTTGNYMFTETSGPATGAVANLTTPFLDLSSLTTPALIFWYHMYGAAMGELHVDVFSGGVWMNDVMTPLIGQQQTASTDPWLQAVVDLSSFSGIIKIRFRGIRGTSFTSDMAIDDVHVDELPEIHDYSVNSIDVQACLIAGGTHTVEAEIENKGNQPETGVTVELREEGGLVSSTSVSLNPGETTTVAFPYTPADSGVVRLDVISSLSGDANALNDTASAYVRVLEAGLDIAFVDGFSDTSFTFANWIITNDDTTNPLNNVWMVYEEPYPNLYTLPITSRLDVFSADADEAGSGTVTLTTAIISLDLSAYSSVMLDVDSDFRIFDAQDTARVKVSPDGGATWITVLEAAGVSHRDTHYTLDLTAKLAMSANAVIAFQSIQPGWDWWWAIDNVCVSGSSGPPPSAEKLLISEIVARPTDGEFVEIYNPGSVAVDLSNHYLANSTFQGGNTYYYQLVVGGGGGGAFADFNARFPDGAMIQPGEYQTIAMAGDSLFFSVHGVLPTYEVYEDSTNFANDVPDMREAVPGSIARPGATGGSSGFSNGDEDAILYYWDGLSDLVVDVDYVIYDEGDMGINEQVDKTGVSIDGPDPGTDSTMYLPDTPIASQVPAPINNTGDGFSTHRIDFTEGNQTPTGGNGVTGADETSENLDSTWTDNSVPTPNGPWETAVAVGEDESQIPEVFALYQNYPNPFNPSTVIRYGVPTQSLVSLKIYNILGQEIGTLVDEVKDAGYFNVIWNGRNQFGSQIASGVYFYRLEAKALDRSDTFRDFKKLLLLK